MISQDTKCNLNLSCQRSAFKYVQFKYALNYQCFARERIKFRDVNRQIFRNIREVTSDKKDLYFAMLYRRGK